MKIVDLGSGAGQDCYVLSKLVGETGHVTGVDMTDEQLEVARKYQQYHAEKFGFGKPNTEFVKGYIEHLGEAGLKDNQFDLIVWVSVVEVTFCVCGRACLWTLSMFYTCSYCAKENTGHKLFTTVQIQGCWSCRVHTDPQMFFNVLEFFQLYLSTLECSWMYCSVVECSWKHNYILNMFYTCMQFLCRRKYWVINYLLPAL